MRNKLVAFLFGNGDKDNRASAKEQESGKDDICGVVFRGQAK